MMLSLLEKVLRVYRQACILHEQIEDLILGKDSVLLKSKGG